MATLLYKWCVLPLLLSGLLIRGRNNENSTNNKSGELHPIHISTVEIDHNETDKTLEITCKIFWDDFEKILAQNYKTKVDLMDANKKAENNKWIADYILKHLQINVDGKILSFGFVGFEKEDVVIFSYLQVDNIPSVKKISVTDNIMHDMFDDQVEIIHVIVKGNRQSTKLEYPNKEASFSF